MTASSAEAEGICTEEPKRCYEIDVLAKDYASYLCTDGLLQTQQFDDSIEELLTKLDEYHGLLDMIRSDTTLCLQKNLPLIRAKTKDMEKIFERIDKLEVFVALVKKNMSAIEEKVSKAESELDTLHGIRKVLNAFSIPSFFTPRSPPAKQAPQYEAPAIFRTKDFFTVSTNRKKDSLLLNTECALPADSHKYDSEAMQTGSLSCTSSGASSSLKLDNTSTSEAAPPSSSSQFAPISTSQSDSASTSQSDGLCGNQPECSPSRKEADSISVNKPSDASELDQSVEDGCMIKTENMTS